ncbi:MAG: GNAT family N-acetyltransferase [Aureispira sp.]|nr:GNAT family N-acetyltransferase [Aureispira sp.]
MIQQLNTLNPTQKKELVTIFTQAFADTPAFRIMFPDEQKRFKNVFWLATQKLELMQNYYTIHSYQEGSIKGFSWWFAPDIKPKISIWQEIKHNFWQVPFRFGWKTFQHMLNFSQQEKKLLLRATAQQPHWVLDVIGLSPDLHGKGIGSQLMQQILQQADEQQISCYVITRNARNLAFYQKLGFELEIEEELPGYNLIAYGFRRQPKKV